MQRHHVSCIALWGSIVNGGVIEHLGYRQSVQSHRPIWCGTCAAHIVCVPRDVSPLHRLRALMVLIPHLPLQIETAAFKSTVSQQGSDVPPVEGAMLAAERARELYGRAFHELVRQVLRCHVVGAVTVCLLLGVMLAWQVAVAILCQNGHATVICAVVG